MGQLYGEFDAMTHEWTDGILSTLIRQGVAATDEDKRWYVNCEALLKIVDVL